MKKIICILCFFSVFFLSFSVFSSAENDAIGEILGSQQDEIYDSLSDETKKMLQEIGVDSISFDNVFNITPKKIFSLVKNLITGQVEAPTRSVIRLMAIIVLLAICECFAPDDERMKTVTQIIGILFCTISIARPVSTAITSAIASISVSESFILTLIPILACVISLTGNPTLAISFQAISFTVAQIIAFISSKYIAPSVGAILALDITDSVTPTFNLSGITGLAKKTLTTILSTTATIYVAFLGLKGALANAADTVASRGIRLAISSAVPVIGGALSEAYSGIVGSIVLARSTLGIFGIAAIALINLPSCLQLVFWIFALRISAAVGELFNQSPTAKLLRSIASAITLLNVVVLFNAVLFIISTALILIIKAG